MKKRVAFHLTWFRLFLAAISAILLALAVSLSGFVSIAASSGHFAPVGWFLHWTMQNAVDRQSMAIDVPKDIDLSDPALVQRAAGHFATGCAPCHGAPGVVQSPVVLAMTPHPPRLEEKVGDWKDRELFWIVKHGIKYSGMPAWPTQDRDDEIWAQVAFLRSLPTLTPAAYAELALGKERPAVGLEAGGEQTSGLNGVVEDALADCARCHGREGRGQGDSKTRGAFPVIAGQPEAYLAETLQAFSKGFRHSGFMQPPATRWSEDVLKSLAAWYASQNPSPQSGNPSRQRESARVDAKPLDGIPPQILPPLDRAQSSIPANAAAGSQSQDEPVDKLALGERIATEGIASRKIPACQSCHGVGRSTKNSNRYPYLTGQPAWYLETHLHLWKDHTITRGGTRFSHLMTPIARNLTDEQIDAVAAWYSQQDAGR